jgi:alkylated DNA repair protein (DNA oxidative demethylase)
MKVDHHATGNLFGPEFFADCPQEPLAPGAVLLRGFAAPVAPVLMQNLQHIVVAAPFRHMITPGGFRMSVAMTNCGDAGWISDADGYRYGAVDPITGQRWPELPNSFRHLAAAAALDAGYTGFEPDACLINRYEPGARLTLHQDRNERDFTAPIVSVSLGLPAIFLFGGASRKHRPRRFLVDNGDITVWGGPARLAYHGIAALEDGNHPLTGRCRINLTFRRAL